jgi:hypothetical protein
MGRFIVVQCTSSSWYNMSIFFEWYNWPNLSSVCLPVTGICTGHGHSYLLCCVSSTSTKKSKFIVFPVFRAVTTNKWVPALVPSEVRYRENLRNNVIVCPGAHNNVIAWIISRIHVCYCVPLNAW